MNRKMLALTDEQYNAIIETCLKGGVGFRMNRQVATVLALEATLCLRVGDIINLKLNDIVKDGERYRLDIVEDKTEKTRTFTVPNEVYQFIKQYAIDNDIKSNQPLFSIKERAVQKYLTKVTDYLGYEGVGTHSFRKYGATQIYIKNDYNVALVQQILQHSSPAITQRYIGIQQKDVETALQGNIHLF